MTFPSPPPESGATTPPQALPEAPALDRSWALFLDVDGTLLEFADRPESVHVPSSLLTSLERLHRALGGALALVSGRPLEQLDTLFAPLHLPAVGLHGLQHRDHAYDPDPPAVEPERLARVHAAAEQLAARFPGAWVEDKGTTLALHWRGVAHAEAALERFALQALEELPGYRLQPGNHVFELRPDGHDKGAAIETLLATPPFTGRRPVFLGDDLTDEFGFAVVNARDGLSVLIGDRRPTQARWELSNPVSVRAWLHEAATRFATEDAIA